MVKKLSVLLLLLQLGSLTAMEIGADDASKGPSEQDTLEYGRCAVAVSEIAEYNEFGQNATIDRIEKHVADCRGKGFDGLKRDYVQLLKAARQATGIRSNADIEDSSGASVEDPKGDSKIAVSPKTQARLDQTAYFKAEKEKIDKKVEDQQLRKERAAKSKADAEKLAKEQEEEKRASDAKAKAAEEELKRKADADKVAKEQEEATKKLDEKSFDKKLDQSMITRLKKWLTVKNGLAAAAGALVLYFGNKHIVQPYRARQKGKLPASKAAPLR